MTIVYFSIENLKAMVKVCGIGIFKWGSQSGAGSRRPGPSHIPRSWIQHCHTLQCNTLSHIVTHRIALSHIVTLQQCHTLSLHTALHCSLPHLHTTLQSNATKALHSLPPQVHQHQALDRQQVGSRHCQPNIDNSRPCVTVCAVNIDK